MRGLLPAHIDLTATFGRDVMRLHAMKLLPHEMVTMRIPPASLHDLAAQLHLELPSPRRLAAAGELHNCFAKPVWVESPLCAGWLP